MEFSIVSYVIRMIAPPTLPIIRVILGPAPGFDFADFSFVVILDIGQPNPLGLLFAHFLAGSLGAKALPLADPWIRHKPPGAAGASFLFYRHFFITPKLRLGHVGPLG